MRRPRFKARADSEVAYYHCISRVVERRFALGAEHKEHFVRTMRRYERFCGVRVVTYCVMSNHFHVLVEVPKRPEAAALTDEQLLELVAGLEIPLQLREVENALRMFREQGNEAGIEELKARFLARRWDVSWFMKLLKQRFTQWFNRREERKGTLWQERFKSVLVEAAGDALSTMAAYIDLNPIRAKIVDDPKDYRWCGYAEAMGGGREALRGLGAIDFARSNHVEVPSDAMGTLANYRIWLFGRGEQREGVIDDEGNVGPIGKVGLDPGVVAKVRAKGGKLGRWELLRCRVRYFSDGVALGSKSWIEAVFEDRRDRFGPRRKTGARPLKGLDLPGLRTMRDLRKAVQVG